MKNAGVDKRHLLFSTGNLKRLKECVSSLKRQDSWVGIRSISPLHLAARYNQIKMCEILLEEGITPDVKEPFTGKTSLHVAAYYGHLEVVKILRKFGADLTSKDCLSCSPIHYAAMGQHRELVLFFLENRVKTSAQSIFGNVLDILIRKKSFKLTDFFSNINGVEALDEYYFREDIPRRSLEDENWTPFHSAAISGQDKIFEMLIEKFPYMPVITYGLRGSQLEAQTSPADLALLEDQASIKKMLRINENTKEYRARFVRRNWYETGFPNRKELCEIIRHRNIRKLKDLIQKEGTDILFQREEKKRHEKFFQSLEKPNALDFATMVYSLPFFDYLIENKIDIPEQEFLDHGKQSSLVFNWALMEMHPLGEGFLKKLDEEQSYE